MPDEDNNFSGSLVLDFRKWLRHVQPKNMEQLPQADSTRTALVQTSTITTGLYISIPIGCS